MPGLPKVTNDTITEFFKRIEGAYDALPVWDGELYYDGFTVYTYRDPYGTENVYDVMPQQ